MDRRITPERAKEFTKELEALLDKYDLCFSSATEFYSAEGMRFPPMFANVELLEKMPDNPKYNNWFTVHYAWEKGEGIIP